MALIGTSTTQPLELFVTKNTLGLWEITTTATSASSIRFSGTDLSKREHFISSALVGLCSKGEGLNPNLATMAFNCADQIMNRLGSAK